MTTFEELLFDGPLSSFLQHVPENMKSFIHGRHSRIGGQLEKDLSNFSWVTADIQCGIHMQLQFTRGAQRPQHGAGNHLSFGQGLNRSRIELAREREGWVGGGGGWGGRGGGGGVGGGR